MRFTATWQLGRKDAILEPSHQVDITGIHVWQLTGATDSHLVKEKDSCSTTKYLRDSPLPMLVVVFFVPINWEISQSISAQSLSCIWFFVTPWTARLLCPCNSPDKNTGGGCHFLLQGIFPTQGSNAGLLHCRQTRYQLSHQGNQISLSTNIYQAKASDNMVRDIKSVR